MSVYSDNVTIEPLRLKTGFHRRCRECGSKLPMAHRSYEKTTGLCRKCSGTKNVNSQNKEKKKP